MSHTFALSITLMLSACATQSAEEAPSMLAMGALPAAAPVALSLDAPANGRIGGPLSLTVTGAAPGETVFLARGTGFGAGPCPPAIGGQCVELTGITRAFAAATADSSGQASFNITVPAATAVGAEATFIAVARRGPSGADSVVSNVERVRANDGTARLRVVHASPDAPNVDIYANGGLLLANVPYLAATGYLSVPPGGYAVDIRAAGSAPTSAPAYSFSVNLDADIDYTGIAAGLLGSADPTDAFRVLAFADDFSGPSSSSFRTRIIHASPDAPTVGLDVGNDGSVEVGALPRFGETGMTGIALPAATSLQVGVVAGGAIPFTLPAFAPGDEITVIATGRVGTRANEADAFGLLAIDKDGVVGFVRQNPVVYALHASPNAPAVDVYVGGGQVIDDLPFRALSGPLQVPPGSYGLDVFDGTGTVFVGTLTTPTLAAGEAYLATVGGLLGGTPGIQLLALADQLALDPTAASVQVLHASPDAPAVEAGAILGGAFVPLTAPLEFGDASDSAGIVVPPGAYDLAVALPGGPVVFQWIGVALNAGDRLFAIATGTLGDGDFGLTIVDPTTTPWSTATLIPN